MNKGDSMLAYRDYSECIKVDPDHWEAYVNRGTILSGQAAYFRAIADFDSAIMIDSTKVQAYINRANAFKQLEMIQEAVNDYSKIINLDPGNMNAVLQRGNLLLIAGDSLGARRDIEAGTRLNPDSEAGINLKSELAFNRAKKAESDGNLQVAVKLYKEALKIRPTYPEPWFFLGVCYGKLGQTTEAIECLSRAIDLRKDYSVALASRGIAFASSGKFKEALSDLGVAIELEKQNGLFRFNRALVYLNMGNKDAACTDLKSALEYGYGDARVVYSRECMNR
jgi:tetratricopeptide (TPR) repeat protein